MTHSAYAELVRTLLNSSLLASLILDLRVRIHRVALFLYKITYEEISSFQ